MSDVNTSKAYDISLRFISFEANNDKEIEASKPKLSKQGYIPKVSKAKDHFTVKKDGQLIRCKLADNKKLKKISVIKNSNKEKVTALNKLFEEKYGEEKSAKKQRQNVKMTKSPEAKRKEIRMSNNSKSERDVG